MLRACRSVSPSLALCATVCIASASPAAVVPVAPFTGDYTDTFNRFTNVDAAQTLSVFDDAGTINNLTEDGAIKVEFSSQLGGDLVRPRSGMMIGQLGVGRWLFDTPVLKFGGWFENNSGEDDATLMFYDAAGTLLGEAVADIPVAAQAWTWNGWESDVPFTRIDVVGNGLVNGFIWYEDMQIVTVPEPAAGTLALLWIGAAIVLRRASRVFCTG